MRRIVLLAVAATIVGLPGPGAAAQREKMEYRLDRAAGVWVHSKSGPPPAWATQDPADALYREARKALNNDEYKRAAEMFRKIRTTYRNSEYAADSYYWESFALYRMGGTANLKMAKRVLAAQKSRHPRANTRSDAEALGVRVDGALAELGDPQAAADVHERVDAHQRVAPRSSACGGEGDDIRREALNALLQMNAAQAVPVLRAVVRRRDGCSKDLRKQAIFLLSQKRTAETEDIMLDVARNDPDRELRAEAVFWLSQIPTEKALTALVEVLRGNDRLLQDKALFALSQMNNPRAMQALRGYAERSDVPLELRDKAIFWIGQKSSPENAAFLRSLYSKLDSDELKEKIFHSVSQQRGQGNGRWLLDIATDSREKSEMRKKALFWASQGGASLQELLEMYNRMDDRGMREQLVFIYSQRRETEAVTKLMEIARRDPDRELRKKAIFWLSQSKDPRVAGFLMDLINRD